MIFCIGQPRHSNPAVSRNDGAIQSRFSNAYATPSDAASCPLLGP